MKESKAFEEIYDYVKDLEIIDTHEHLPAFENLRETDTDVLKEYLTQYFNRDLISAGLNLSDYEKVINNKYPLMDRWILIDNYLFIIRKIEDSRNHVKGQGFCLSLGGRQDPHI